MVDQFDRDKIQEEVDDEAEIQGLRELFGDLPELKSDVLVMYDLEKMKYFTKLFKSFKTFFSDSDVNLSYEISDPVPSIGYISLIGRKINLTDKLTSEEFLELLNKVDNIDVYMLSNGLVRADFTFYRLLHALS